MLVMISLDILQEKADMVFDFPCHNQLKRRLASKRHVPLRFCSLLCEAHLHPILCVVSTHRLHQLSVFNLCILTNGKRYDCNIIKPRKEKSWYKGRSFVKGVAAEIRPVAALCTSVFHWSMWPNAVKPHQFMCTMTVSSLSLSFTCRQLKEWVKNKTKERKKTHTKKTIKN